MTHTRQKVIASVTLVATVGLAALAQAQSISPSPSDAPRGPAIVAAPAATIPLSSPCNGAAARVSLSERAACPLSAADEGALKPRDIFKECDNCPEMIVVPAGEFMMGSPNGEIENKSDEVPRHRVMISQQFAVGRFAVTFAEWDACVAEDGCDGYKPSDEGWGHGRQPVINISWKNAKAYLAWLSRKTGKSYRLLSEAEWEYAARAGTTTPFWWGSSIDTQQANYDGTQTYGRSTKGKYREKTMPVDSFAPNLWGLYQVHGNVMEWVEDCLQYNYAGAPMTARPGRAEIALTE